MKVEQFKKTPKFTFSSYRLAVQFFTHIVAPYSTFSRHTSRQVAFNASIYDDSSNDGSRRIVRVWISIELLNIKTSCLIKIKDEEKYKNIT